MTPFELEILLHYHCIAADHRACVENVPIWAGTRDAFIAEGLLVTPSRLRSRTYDLGERGEAYIKAVLATPLPVQRWVMPMPGTWAEELSPPQRRASTEA